MRTMYDSTAAADIPTTAAMVGGYVSPSSFAWSTADWARFPSAVHVAITPSAGHTGLGIPVLDVESGDATPAQAPGWAAAQRAAGQEPTVYCSASVWGAVQAAFSSAGEPHPNYWVAAYPGTGANLPTLNGITAVAHQYADPATSGGHFDLSVVADVWPGVDTQTSTPGGIESMAFTDTFRDWDGNTQTVLSWMNNVDQRLAVALGQLTGSEDPTKFPGHPQLGNRTLVDGVSVIGDNADKYAAASAARDAATQAAVAKIPTTQATVTVDAATLQAALTAAGVSADQIAQATVSLFGQKIGA